VTVELFLSRPPKQPETLAHGAGLILDYLIFAFSVAGRYLRFSLPTGPVPLSQ
jgi:hypothetical protein